MKLSLTEYLEKKTVQQVEQTVPDDQNTKLEDNIWLFMG
jgi:hypothetical protein